MALDRRQLLTAASGAAAAVLLAPRLADLLPSSAVFASPLDPAPETAFLALQRLAYGPTPDELAAVRRLGLPGWVEQQLHPAVDDGEVAAALLNDLTYPQPIPQSRQARREAQIAQSDAALMDSEMGREAMTPAAPPAADRPRPRAEQLPLTWWNSSLDQRWPALVQAYRDNRPLARRPGEELKVVQWVRAVHSPWQLREVLVEFWHNHFSIDLEADRRIPVVFPDHDQAIRTHALGNFRELLEAVAASPAMLYYLNNAQSRPEQPNENFARELFELHTLGEEQYVVGGYTEQDVLEAARAFTGWTVAAGGGRGRQGRPNSAPNTGAFRIRQSWHDTGTKRILGDDYPAGLDALTEGRRVLERVAFHPATARLICTKLCRRLIADDPPQDVVDAAIATWTREAHAPHQLREVVRTIATHPRSTQGWGAKVKSPFECAVSYLRGIGAEVRPTPVLIRDMNTLGYRQFTWPAPNGRPDRAGFWLTTNGMLGRWNLFLQLGTQGAAVDILEQTPEQHQVPAAACSYWSQRLLGIPADPVQTDAVCQAVGAGRPLDESRARLLTSLIAMTPAFQRR